MITVSFCNLGKDGDIADIGEEETGDGNSLMSIKQVVGGVGRKGHSRHHHVLVPCDCAADWRMHHAEHRTYTVHHHNVQTRAGCAKCHKWFDQVSHQRKN